MLAGKGMKAIHKKKKKRNEHETLAHIGRRGEGGGVRQDTRRQLHAIV